MLPSATNINSATHNMLMWRCTSTFSVPLASSHSNLSPPCFPFSSHFSYSPAQGSCHWVVCFCQWRNAIGRRHVQFNSWFLCHGSRRRWSYSFSGGHTSARGFDSDSGVHVEPCLDSEWTIGESLSWVQGYSSIDRSGSYCWTIILILYHRYSLIPNSLSLFIHDCNPARCEHRRPKSEYSKENLYNSFNRNALTFIL